MALHQSMLGFCVVCLLSVVMEALPLMTTQPVLCSPLSPPCPHLHKSSSSLSAHLRSLATLLCPRMLYRAARALSLGITQEVKCSMGKEQQQNIPCPYGKCWRKCEKERSVRGHRGKKMRTRNYDSYHAEVIFYSCGCLRAYQTVAYGESSFIPGGRERPKCPQVKINSRNPQYNHLSISILLFQTVCKLK